MSQRLAAMWDMLLDCSLKNRKQTSKKTAAGTFGVSVQLLHLPPGGDFSPVAAGGSPWPGLSSWAGPW